MKKRNSQIHTLKSESFDVLIVGGGINGASSAAALSARGLKVALVDKGDFASMTSQESSNMVWGGIKYLENFEFGLVNKLCRSRNELIKAYPSSVIRIRFYVNLWNRSPLLFYCGAWLYWLMGRLFTRTPRFLSAKKVSKEEPAIDVTDHNGGVEYSDAYLLDNDARLTFSFIKKAWSQGAVAVNYVEVLDSYKNEDGLWENLLIDHVTGERFHAVSKVLINACGPLASVMNQQHKMKTKHKIVYSKGVHLTVPQLTKVKRVITFYANDGRLFFILPMGHCSCLGTTDTRMKEYNNEVKDEDRRFILNNINKRLKLDKELKADDIISERCGVRPLVVENQDTGDDDWMSLSRKHVVETQEKEKHITIFGGKLTDCLNVGDEVFREVARLLELKINKKSIRWFGESSSSKKKEFLDRARKLGLSRDILDGHDPSAERLWRRYDMDAHQCLDMIENDPSMAEEWVEGTGFLRCESQYIMEHEMVVKVEDLLRRRSKLSLITDKGKLLSEGDFQKLQGFLGA